MPVHDAAPPAASHHSHLLIIGAGIFGVSTAYHLANTLPDPSAITIIDRSPFPPHHAASTDINKILREDYTVPFYMDLAAEAMHAWSTWPDLSAFFHRTGWVNLNSRGSDLGPRIRHNFKARGHDPTDDLSLDDLKAKFGPLFQQTDLSECDSAYWNPKAGWCDAAAATAKLTELALQRGVKYVCEDVTELRYAVHSETVTGAATSTGAVYTADKILLCSGAWTSSLMSPLEDQLRIPNANRIESQIKAAGVCVAHYALSDDEYRHLDANMPVTIYAFHGDAQPPPAESRLLKFTNSLAFMNHVTTPGGSRISVPPSRPQDQVSEKLKEETIRLVPARLFPQYTSNRPVDRWRLCWDSISPTQDQLITRHPDPRLSHLFVAAGGSFHSWKFLPIIGKYVANVLEGKSNGREKDRRWAWKSGDPSGRGAHEKAYPTRELSDLAD